MGMSAAQARLWRSASGTTRRRTGTPARAQEPQKSVEAIDRGLRDLVAREFPDVWEDLSETGQEMFVRGLVEAASRPPEDRAQAVADVIETWREAQALLYAPIDDEPYTDEERAEDDAALERFGQGDCVPLEDLLPRDGLGR
jgi:hypothetical protein